MAMSFALTGCFSTLSNLATRIDFTTRLRLVLESYIYSAMPLFKLDGTELTARFPELPSHIVSYIATYKISMRYVYT